MKTNHSFKFDYIVIATFFLFMTMNFTNGIGNSQNIAMNNSIKVDGGQYLVNLVVPPAPIKPKELTPNGGEENGKEISSSSDEAPKPEKSKEEKAAEELTEAIRDLQISHLKKFPAESTQRAELLRKVEYSPSGLLATLPHSTWSPVGPEAK